ncbi:MAG: serine/threonine-protein kinase [Dokdonella sp.]
MKPAERELEHAIGQLLDDERPQWPALSALASTRPRELEALRIISDVAAGFRDVETRSPATQPVLFRWGPIEVHERLAQGHSADVYRAFEPNLRIIVALKLRRDAADSPTTGRFLEEARHLARLHHANIVRVYGAGIHDGRAGLWCEWIDGPTLADILSDRGRFTPIETAWVGIELCRALATLHDAGMLHGDLKPGNVMRERDGRIVLVDLGAGGRADDVNAASTQYGTPGYLPPEVLAGAARDGAQDLYALGHLLIDLLNHGREKTAAPDASIGALQRVLARATASAIDARYRSACALEIDLSAALARIVGVDPVTPAATRPRPGKRLVSAVALVAVMALAFVMLRPLLAPWDTRVALLLRTSDGTRALTSGAALGNGERMLAELTSNRSTHVYVLNEDALGALHVLFPLAGLDQANPLPVNETIRLPGRQAGRELSWELQGNGGREEFLVVIARQPLAQLEKHLAAMPSVSLENTERGVSRARAELPGGIALTGTRLVALLDELAPALADDDQVRVFAYRFNAAEGP